MIATTRVEVFVEEGSKIEEVINEVAEKFGLELLERELCSSCGETLDLVYVGEDLSSHINLTDNLYDMEEILHMSTLITYIDTDFEEEEDEEIGTGLN